MNAKNLSLQSPILDVMTYNIRKELLKRITKYSFELHKFENNIRKSLVY